MISCRPVAAFASRTAASTASAPLEYNWVRFRSPGASSAISLTSAARCSDVKLPTCTRSSWQADRSEEHTSELQSRQYLVCRLLLEKKKNKQYLLCTVRRCLYVVSNSKA